MSVTAEPCYLSYRNVHHSYPEPSASRGSRSLSVASTHRVHSLASLVWLILHLALLVLVFRLRRCSALGLAWGCLLLARRLGIVTVWESISNVNAQSMEGVSIPDLRLRGAAFFFGLPFGVVASPLVASPSPFVATSVEDAWSFLRILPHSSRAYFGVLMLAYSATLAKSIWMPFTVCQQSGSSRESG